MLFYPSAFALPSAALLPGAVSSGARAAVPRLEVTTRSA
jgi:hypothetical protein